MRTLALPTSCEHDTPVPLWFERTTEKHGVVTIRINSIRRPLFLADAQGVGIRCYRSFYYDILTTEWTVSTTTGIEYIFQWPRRKDQKKLFKIDFSARTNEINSLKIGSCQFKTLCNQSVVHLPTKPLFHALKDPWSVLKFPGLDDDEVFVTFHKMDGKTYKIKDREEEYEFVLSKNNARVEKIVHCDQDYVRYRPNKGYVKDEQVYSIPRDVTRKRAEPEWIMKLTPGIPPTEPQYATWRRPHETQPIAILLPMNELLIREDIFKKQKREC